MSPGRSAGAPSGRRRRSPATRPSARPSSPTSTGCPMPCSSWPATRTTSVASPSRCGSREPDVAAVDAIKGGLRRRARRTSRAGRRSTTLRSEHASRHDRREAGRERHHETGEPAWEASDRIKEPARLRCERTRRGARDPRRLTGVRRRASGGQRDRHPPVRDRPDEVRLAAGDPQRQRHAIDSRPA